MKFNDGFWLLKHGVKPYYGIQVVQQSSRDDSCILHVATKPIRHRGDTLGGPLLTVKLHAPTEGVIGVKITHFENTPSVQIPLFPDATATPKASVAKSEAGLTLISGDLSVSVTEKPYTLSFKAQERTLAVAGAKHQAVIDVPQKWTVNSVVNTSCLSTDPSSNPHPDPPPPMVRYVNSELTISPGELFYGLGEQFGAFVKNGQSVTVWNQDGGTSSEQAYKCVPFYMSNRGYGVFINHPGAVEVEVGSEKVSRVGISVADESLEWFIIHGDTPLQVLERYTQMTGRPALPPAWTFGLWLSTSFLTDYDSKTVSGFLKGMQDRNCNVRVFHFDCFWMKQYEWCSFTFDEANFPNPRQYLHDIKERFGVKVCVWINPYISQLSPIFREASENKYLIRRKDGGPWQWDLWQPGLGILDVTNPKAREWYAAKLEKLIDLGVDCFKTDFGERIPHANVRFFDESDPVLGHNLYSVMYNQLVFELLERRFGKHEAVVFARSSTVGGQRFPVHWGGDCESTFEAMAEALRGLLSLTSSGFAFASHDIGGFEGHPPPEIYHRWVAFGIFSTHTRLHGSSSYRVPWEYGEDAAETLAKLLNVKHMLMPYIYSHAIKSHLMGHPLQRAMILEFIGDRTTHCLDRQFMLGPSLLVAPVFVTEGEETEYYIPKGRWTSLNDPNRKVDGPTWVKEVVPLDAIPLWIRPNTALPLGPSHMKTPDYDFSKRLSLAVYEPSEGSTIRVDVPSGNRADFAGSIRVTLDGQGLRVLVDGAVEIASVSLHSEGLEIAGDSTETVEGNPVYTVAEGTRDITIPLKRT